MYLLYLYAFNATLHLALEGIPYDELSKMALPEQKST
jgi:hypothetical protein